MEVNDKPLLSLFQESFYLYRRSMPFTPSHKLSDHKLVNSLSKQPVQQPGSLLRLHDFTSNSVYLSKLAAERGKVSARREIISTSFRTSRAALTLCPSGEIRNNKLVEKGGKVWTKHTSLLDACSSRRMRGDVMKKMMKVKQTKTKTHS